MASPLPTTRTAYADVAQTLSDDVCIALTGMLDFTNCTAQRVDNLAYELARSNLHHAVSQFINAANTTTFAQRTSR